MEWFGESWGAPVNADAEHAETPTGEPCAKCAEPIAATDRGLILPAIGRESGHAAYHLPCLLDVLGISERARYLSES